MDKFFPSQKPLEFTRAQVALLSQFDTPRQLRFSGYHDSWLAVLREEPDATLQRFIKSGLIVQPSIEQYAELLTIPKLKAILKKINLPVSGKKSVLVERLLSSQYDILSEFTERYWICSESGFSHVKPYLEAEAQRRQQALTGTREALDRGDLVAAARIAAEYHYNDVFGSISLSGEVQSDGIKTTVYPAKLPAARTKEILEGLKIYQMAKHKRPAPFINVPAKIFNEAADACTWSCLQLGKGERKAEAERTALELWGWRVNRQHIARYKESESRGIITGIKILCGGGCPVAARHENKVYSVAKAPELPLIGCTREPCCACTYTAQVRDF